MRVFDSPADYLERFTEDKGNFDRLMSSFFNDSYGQANNIGQNLIELGYPSAEIIPNHKIAQIAWFKENIDESFSIQNNWKEFILSKQIEYYRPEILMFVGWSYGGEYVKEIKEKYSFIRKIIFWTGESLPQVNFMKYFDSVFSCDTSNVLEINKNNKSAFHINHAFNTSINDRLCDNEKRNAISFCGSIKHGLYEHSYRAEMISELIEKHPISLNGNVYVPNIYSKNIRGIVAKTFHDTIDLIDRHFLPMNRMMSESYNANIGLRKDYIVFNKLFKKFESPIYGLMYLQKLKDTNIILNTHSNTSFACNMRLFEGTGVGSCLLSDYKKNIHELFDIDTEIVCYNSKDELLEKANYLLYNPQKALEIGQKAMSKVKKMHTYKHRIHEYINAFEKVLTQ